MNLLDQAIKLAAEMDEPLDQNYVRKHALEQAEELGISVRQAATRVFSDQGPGPSAVSDPIWGRSWVGCVASLRCGRANPTLRCSPPFPEGAWMTDVSAVCRRHSPLCPTPPGPTPQTSILRRPPG